MDGDGIQYSDDWGYKQISKISHLWVQNTYCGGNQGACHFLHWPQDQAVRELYTYVSLHQQIDHEGRTTEHCGVIAQVHNTRRSGGWATFKYYNATKNNYHSDCVSP